MYKFFGTTALYCGNGKTIEVFEECFFLNKKKTKRCLVILYKSEIEFPVFQEHCETSEQ